MSNKQPAERPEETVRRQMKEIRKRSRRVRYQADLTVRLRDIGSPLSRLIGKIESGERKGISLNDAFELAYALDVSLASLCLPHDDDAEVILAEKVRASSRDVRWWLRGQEPLPGQDRWTYETDVSDEERQRVLDAKRGVVDEQRRVRPETAEPLDHPIVESEGE